MHVHINKVVVKILQGSVVTQAVLGGLAIGLDAPGAAMNSKTRAGKNLGSFRKSF